MIEGIGLFFYAIHGAYFDMSALYIMSISDGLEGSPDPGVGWSS